MKYILLILGALVLVDFIKSRQVPVLPPGATGWGV
jgi:hypothetical protein